jgi:hypothetical protein
MNSDTPTPPSSPSLQSLLHAAVAQRAARRQQNILLGVLAGFMAMLAGTGLWVTLATAAGTECAFLAPGVGFLVGASIQFFGRGIGRLFSVLGAVLAAGACLLGTLFAACATLAQTRQDGFWTTLGTLQPESALALLRRNFGPSQLLFFSLAIGLGWWLARRRAPAVSRS